MLILSFYKHFILIFLLKTLYNQISLPYTLYHLITNISIYRLIYHYKSTFEVTYKKWTTSYWTFLKNTNLYGLPLFLESPKSHHRCYSDDANDDDYDASLPVDLTISDELLAERRLLPPKLTLLSPIGNVACCNVNSLLTTNWH